MTDIEAQIGSRYTYETLAWLKRRAPHVRFVWIMGADNLRQFHLWRHWRAIADLGADRRRRPAGLDPAGDLQPGGGRARPWRAPERDAARFAELAPPALLFLHGPRSGLSSTALRACGRRENGEATPTLSDYDVA